MIQPHHLLLATSLVQASVEINLARQELRDACSNLAGTPLDWSIEDLMEYADLAHVELLRVYAN